ncbi:NFACT RNA binding domain-containing protein [Seleniivibrio woodruffii]|uniref:NFACT RNA binding domain-containing protein n=1 Tax=Seleniivibrio woodruffii TaxID=1078050 RepID=UPI0039E4836F
MDGLTLTKAVNIIKERYTGVQVTKINVTEDSVTIGLFAKDRKSLHIRVTGGSPALFTSDTQEGVPDQFLDRLSGGKITDVGGRRYDRLFWLDIVKRRPSGKLETHKLVFELIGKMSNAVLLNEGGNIIWMFAKNNADPDRSFSVGDRYASPRLNKRDTLEKYASNNFSDLLGFYPVTVKHAEIYLAKGYSFAETATLINESLTDDVFHVDSQGRVIPFKPYEDGETITLDDLKGRVHKPAAKRDDSIRLRLTRLFEKQAEKYLVLKDKLKEEYAEAETYPKVRAKADLLKANLHILKNAKGKTELTNYTESGIETVVYDVPEFFDANKEVNRLYGRADKLERSVALVKSRMGEVDNIIDSALEQLYFIEISAKEDDLRELALEMKKSEPKQKKQIKEKQFIKMEIGGGTAYIGRNSVSNHRLVFQFANPEDMWFHAQKLPSAHLIFRKSGNATPDEIEQCAAIVAGMSKAKNNLKVTVDYTQKKNVKKPKNTPPGFVIYHRFRSVDVAPVHIDEKTD